MLLGPPGREMEVIAEAQDGVRGRRVALRQNGRPVAWVSIRRHDPRLTGDAGAGAPQIRPRSPEVSVVILSGCTTNEALRGSKGGWKGPGQASGLRTQGGSNRGRNNAPWWDALRRGVLFARGGGRDASSTNAAARSADQGPWMRTFARDPARAAGPARRAGSVVQA